MAPGPRHRGVGLGAAGFVGGDLEIDTSLAWARIELGTLGPGPCTPQNMRRLALALVAVIALSAAHAHAEAADDVTSAPLPEHDSVPELPQPMDAEASPSEPTAVSAPDPMARAPRRVWYGWQTLLTDAAAVTLVSVGVRAKSGLLAGTGAFSYAFGGSVVHGMHEHTYKALASFGVRIGAPILGFVLGAASADSNCAKTDYDCQDDLGPAFSGFLIGVLTASAFDAAILAHEDEKSKLDRSPVIIAPSVSLSRGSGSVGVVGVF